MTNTVDRPVPWSGRGPWTPPQPPPWATVPAGFGPVPVTSWTLPPRPAPRRGWVVLAVVGAVLLVALLGSAVAAQRTMDVTGTVSITGAAGTVAPFSACGGAGYLGWLDSGTPVSIRDGEGAVVGTGSLGPGVSGPAGWSGWSDSCTFAFSVDDVPAGSEYYRVTVGSDTSETLFSRSELQASGAHITY